MNISDPIERIVAGGLDAADIKYRHDSEGARLDFELENGLLIEVKQFSTPRTADQIDGVPNVIVIQGRDAAMWFANILTP